MSLPAPHSPCINVCNIGPRGWCSGCYRTLDEIAGWVHFDATARWAAIRAAEQRRLSEQASIPVTVASRG